MLYAKTKRLESLTKQEGKEKSKKKENNIKCQTTKNMVVNKKDSPKCELHNGDVQIHQL